MPSTWINSLVSINSARTGKRVSFEDMTDPKPDKMEKDHSITIEELFPTRPLSPVPRRSLPDLDHIEKAPTLSKPKKRVYKAESIVSNRPHRIPPFKKPTEPLALALLRTMSHKKPDKRTNLPDIGLIVKAESEKRRSPRRKVKTKILFSPSSQDSGTSEVASSKYMSSEVCYKSNVAEIVLKCGKCLERKRTTPAAGFCRYCDEYLCASCVYQHKGLLTRSHVVMVFKCETCQKMNVLNQSESGFCVICMKYYCPRCLILHCTKTNHDMLEGNDLLDVVYSTIHRDVV